MPLKRNTGSAATSFASAYRLRPEFTTNVSPTNYNAKPGQQHILLIIAADALLITPHAAAESEPLYHAAKK